MTLSTTLRNVVLTAHVTTSVGWLGAAFAFVVVNVATLMATDPAAIRGGVIVMQWLVVYAIVPLALASLAIGVLNAVGTKWGLLRHYWVVFKLGLTTIATIVLLLYTGTMADIARLSADATINASDLRSSAASPLLHGLGSLGVLLITTVLSVFKPRGLTPYGQTKRLGD